MKKLLLVLGLLLCAIPGHAQTITSSANDGASCTNNGLTTCTVTITAPASGDVIYVSGITRGQHLGGASSDCTTAVNTNGGGNSFFNIANVQFDTVGTRFIFACYAKNVTNAPTTVTVTVNGASTDVFEVATAIIHTVDTTAPLDLAVNTLGPGCAGGCTIDAAPASASFTTNFGNEIIVCAVAMSSNTATFSAPTNSFSIVQQETNPGHNAQLSRTVTSLTTSTCGATLSSAQFWSVALASFKSSSQAAPAGAGSGGKTGDGGISGDGD